MLLADVASWHKGPEITKLHKHLLLSWPPNSPDLNPIEDLWATVKRRLREMWVETERRPHSSQDLTPFSIYCGCQSTASCSRCGLEIRVKNSRMRLYLRLRCIKTAR